MKHENTKKFIYLASKDYGGHCDIVVKFGWRINNRYCLCLLLFLCVFFYLFYLYSAAKLVLL
jgi:hypothetical protein